MLLAAWTNFIRLVAVSVRVRRLRFYSTLHLTIWIKSLALSPSYAFGAVRVTAVRILHYIYLLWWVQSDTKSTHEQLATVYVTLRMLYTMLFVPHQPLHSSIGLFTSIFIIPCACTGLFVSLLLLTLSCVNIRYWHIIASCFFFLLDRLCISITFLFAFTRMPLHKNM